MNDLAVFRHLDSAPWGWGMNRTSLLPAVLAASICFLVNIGGCTKPDSAPVQEKTQPVSQPSSDPVTLSLSKDGVFTVVVTNTTGMKFVFSPVWDQGINIYHESPNGEKVNLTNYHMHAEVGPLLPFQTVSLPPEASCTLKVKSYASPGFKLDLGEHLKKSGVVYAVVSGLTVDSFDERYEKEAKKARLLDEELRSDTISVPLDP